ncbi:hypothetical protein RDWZM_000143 [Blomia tropicalis]|uniref:Carbonic anhydrase n=1 Tax=Blomia tropicalis TaxID=40697 RepID=A0A9Q0M861_BLOTA|nr:hypothetical protein RDWZM_000143 [Blomia tropicalis]
MFKISKLVIIVAIFNHFVNGSDWIYEEQTEWGNTFPECGGNQQSPISMTTDETVLNANYNIRLINYDNAIKDFDVMNTGHSIQFTYKGNISKVPIVSGTVVDGQNYSLHQIHFHWGQTNGKGSEHRIDGQYFDMEVHLVHYNRVKYPTWDEAIQSNQGALVLSSFLQVQGASVPKLDSIVDMVNRLTDSTDSITLPLNGKPFTARDLLPDHEIIDEVDIFRYVGSLTTPPCTEGVLWLVINAFGAISEQQMNVFRSVKDVQHNLMMGNNYRSLHPLNGRTLERFRVR